MIGAGCAAGGGEGTSSTNSSSSGSESSSSSSGMGGAGGMGGSGGTAGMGGMGGASVCGDGMITGSEECDDGNENAADRCDKCQVVCGANEHEFSGNHHCYADFNTQKINYSLALAVCDSKGGFLVSITSQAAQDFVYGTVLDKNVDLPRWIGLTDLVTEGTFKWKTAEPFAYMHWIMGQPDNFDMVEGCVEMYQGTGEWNDDNCSYEYQYICEFIPAGI